MFISDPYDEMVSGLANLSELLTMKDPSTYTTVETSLSNFVDYHLKWEGWERDV